MSWKIEQASLRALMECLPIALRSSTEQRRNLIMRGLAEILEQGHGDRVQIVRAVMLQANLPRAQRGKKTLAAGIVVLGGDGSGNLLAVDIDPIANLRFPSLSGALLEAIFAFLHEQGVPFLQALRDAGEDQPLLREHGCMPLAELDYCVAAVAEPDTAVPGAGNGDLFELLPYRRWVSELRGDRGSLANQKGDPFEQLVEATFAGSLDFPAIAPYQTAPRALRGYREITGHDPDWWFVVRGAGNEGDGCLLLTPKQESQIVEITYMGLIPAVRGKRLGEKLLRWTHQLAKAGGFERITLAVDRANHPARKLYTRNGFEILFSETVWGGAIENLGGAARAAKRSRRAA